MSKLSEHLQAHLEGEVLASSEARNYFATDGSVFAVPPRVIVYPKHLTDVRKVVRFSWQLAEQGKPLPITARGKGTDQAGGALGDGIMLVLPSHLNKLLGFDKTDVTVQPGLVYGDLQRTLHSHGRFLPPYPSSIDFSTIGGAVANNACGEKSLKYGCTANYVRSLEVVLANGQVIRAERLSKKQLNLKKGQTDLEGEIYRKLDGLIDDNWQLIQEHRPLVSKSAAGYALWNVKDKDGSLDLSKLFVGSQGTLGIVTEITLSTEAYNPNPDMLTGFFDDIEKAGAAVMELQDLQPSAMELVDRHLLEFLQKHQPAVLQSVGIAGMLPEMVLLIEFDEAKRKDRDKKTRQAHKILRKYAVDRRVIPNHLEQESDWKLRHSAAAIIWQDKGSKKALPIIEDGVVPATKLPEFLAKVYDLFKKHNLEIAVWGHAGDANLHMQPFLDLGNVGDRQTVFKLMDEFYQMVIEMGGSTSGEHNDGRLRAQYLKDLYGAEMYGLFAEVKRMFDPYNILNPGVKIGVKREDLLPLLRKEYSMKHLYDHMPQPS